MFRIYVVVDEFGNVELIKEIYIKEEKEVNPKKPTLIMSKHLVVTLI